MSRLHRCLLGAALLLAVSAPSLATDENPYVSHELRITGDVEETLVLEPEEMATFPQSQIERVPLICRSGAERGEKHDLTAVRLRDLIKRAGIHAPTPKDARKMAVIAKAADDYWVTFSWGELFNNPSGEHIYVYYREQGQPLGDDEGRFALLATRDHRTGARQVKWLGEIEVRRLDP